MAGGLTLEQFRERAMPDRYTPAGSYQSLDDSMKALVSEKEYAWLGADGRHRLEQDLTEPDPES